MKCPTCSLPLAEIDQSGLKVDVCKDGCGGIWFDHLELGKVDEQNESLGEIILDATRFNYLPIAKDAKRSCPRCKDAVMIRHFYSVRRETEIDECPACGGVWLDAGELASIRREFTTDDQRKQASDQYFSTLSGTHFAVQASESRNDAERKQKFARALRFITPSYWIPGKQRGGAF